MNRVHSMTVISILKVFQYTTCEKNVLYLALLSNSVCPVCPLCPVCPVHDDHLNHMTISTMMTISVMNILTMMTILNMMTNSTPPPNPIGQYDQKILLMNIFKNFPKCTGGGGFDFNIWECKTRFATLAKDIHHHSVFAEFMSNYITATHRHVTKLNNIK